MAGRLSVRMTPLGRTECFVPADQTPILDIIEGNRTVLTLTPRRLDEVSAEELEAARSLLAALTAFVEACQPWVVPAAPATPVVTAGGAA